MLDPLTKQRHFVLRCAFLPTAAAPMLSSWFYQSLPLFSFVLHSFLPYNIDDDLVHTCYGFVAWLGKHMQSWGSFYTILCLECCQKCIWIKIVGASLDHCVTLRFFPATLMDISARSFWNTSHKKFYQCKSFQFLGEEPLKPNFT